MSKEKETQAERTYGYVQERKNSYLRVFSSENRDVENVLGDLARFCRASKTTFHPNPHVQAQLEGRREVILRIAQQLNLDVNTLFNLATRGEPK
jgi:hypothetical protein